MTTYTPGRLHGRAALALCDALIERCWALPVDGGWWSHVHWVNRWTPVHAEGLHPGVRVGPGDPRGVSLVVLGLLVAITGKKQPFSSAVHRSGPLPTSTEVFVVD